jgi:hypothetical protein
MIDGVATLVIVRVVEKESTADKSGNVRDVGTTSADDEIRLETIRFFSGLVTSMLVFNSGTPVVDGDEIN